MDRLLIKKPIGNKKVNSYKLPSGDDLIRQGVNRIICEACMFFDHCYGEMCMANKEWLGGMGKSMFDASGRNREHEDIFFIQVFLTEHGMKYDEIIDNKILAYKDGKNTKIENAGTEIGVIEIVWRRRIKLNGESR